MPRGKQGTKATRGQLNAAYQRKLRERKRLRKQRAEQFAHLPGQQPQYAAPENPLAPDPEGFDERILTKDEQRESFDRNFTVGELRNLADDRGLPVRSRDRKSDIIDMLMGEHPRLRS